MLFAIQDRRSRVFAYTFIVEDEFNNTDILPKEKVRDKNEIHLLKEDFIVTETNRVGEISKVSNVLDDCYWLEKKKS